MKKILIIALMLVSMPGWAVAETLVNVPTKSSGDSVTAAEINEILSAIKNGTRSIKTLSMHITQKTAAPSSPATNAIYLADGTTWDPASLSIGKAYYVLYDESSYQPLWDEDGNVLFNTTSAVWSKPLSLPDVDGTEDGVYWTAPLAGTVTGVTCVMDPGGTGDSVTVDVQMCSSDMSTCTSVLSSAITVQNGVYSGTIDTANDDFSAGQHMKLVIGTPGAGSVIDLLTITVKGTY